MLNQIEEIPAGLLDCEASELHSLLGGPTLIHLAGARQPALFVSVLMHGNETTGWMAVRALLNKYYRQSKGAPRALSLFIANTKAAQVGVRHLPSQLDFNRVWPSSELHDSPEHQLMNQVWEIMRKRKVFASVDIHNNTGLNPHYACVNNLNSTTLQLATLFSRTVIYFLRPLGVQSLAMARLCPAVTLECGRPNEAAAFEHALRYLDACIHLHSLPKSPVAPHDIDLFHTTATVTIPETITFGFAPSPCELTLPENLDHYNFRELPIGTSFGTVNRSGAQPLRVVNEGGQDVFDNYFKLHGNSIESKKILMPSMLTSNLEVVRQDCLCYLMERYTDHIDAV